MIDKSKIEKMGLLNWLEKNTSYYIEREDDDFYYEYLQTLHEKIEKLENSYEYLKALVKANKSKAPFYSILKLISEKLPKKFMTKEICLLAVKNDGMSLRYVPKELLDYEICLSAVENNGSAIEYVPEQYLTDALIDIVIKRHPKSLMYGGRFLSEERCFGLVRDNVEIFRYIPSEFQSKRIVEFAIDKDPKLIAHVTNENMEKQCCPDIKINTPCIIPKIGMEKGEAIISKSEEGVIYDLSKSDNAQINFFYISDIHLEHQLNLAEKTRVKRTVFDLKRLIEKKIDEMLANIDTASGILLIGGDVADDKFLTKLFFSELRKKWDERIIYVLGNHELWDSDIGNNDGSSVDKTIEEYRILFENSGIFNFLLENELLIEYKGNRAQWERLSESNILETSDEDLATICERSTMLILGGIGFAGRNTRYNAKSGIYRQVVSREEEQQRSCRFKAVYDKLLKCAEKMPLIVMTHMPMRDWSEKDYNPNWIYLNGHTHANTLIKENDGTTVLADNQLGYTPQSWHLKGFCMDKKIYDPFKDYQDGTYELDLNDYIQFNRGRGIQIHGTKRLTDDMFFIKRGDYYMFLQYNSKGKLRLLAGGNVRKLACGKEFYEENFELYIRKVCEIFSPYQNAIKIISSEVKKFGGNGEIHGTIVDIDFFNHIYLNPLDGKITPYYATNMVYKQPYSNVKELLLKSPFKAVIESKNMLAKFMKLIGNKDLSILSDIDQNFEQRKLPKFVLDTKIYYPSRIMKSFQYTFDKKVLRNWDNTILNYDAGGQQSLLSGSDDS